MSGYIYLLNNPCFKESILKIGFTEKEPHERLSSLNKSTSVPQNFELEYADKVNNVKVAEKRVHLLLNEYRVSDNKEFFRIDKNQAIYVINRVAHYNEKEDYFSENIRRIRGQAPDNSEIILTTSITAFNFQNCA